MTVETREDEQAADTRPAIQPDGQMDRRERVARSVAAAIVCCLPLATVLLTAWIWRDVTFGDMATQSLDDDVSTVAPAWTALLLPLCGTLICAVAAVTVATDLDPLFSRKAYFFSFGIGAILVAAWLTLLIPNLLTPEDPPAPTWMLLSPLALPLGFVPFAIAGLGARRTRKVRDES